MRVRRNIKQRRVCRRTFLGSVCTKLLGRTREISGVCAIRQKTAGSPSVICCPNRIYAEDYKMLRTVSRMAFGNELPLCAGRAAVAKAKSDGGAVAVFGHGWGGELRLPKRNGVGSYFVDWVLARLDGMGRLVDFAAIEVQTIDTTGKYGDARKELIKDRSILRCTRFRRPSRPSAFLRAMFMGMQYGEACTVDYNYRADLGKWQTADPLGSHLAR